MKSTKRIEYLRNNGTFSEVYSVDNPPPYPVTANGIYPNMSVGVANKAVALQIGQLETGLSVPLTSNTQFSLIQTGLDSLDKIILVCDIFIGGAVTPSATVNIICEQISPSGASLFKYSGTGITQYEGGVKQYFVYFTIIGDLNNPTIVLRDVKIVNYGNGISIENGKNTTKINRVCYYSYKY